MPPRPLPPLPCPVNSVWVSRHFENIAFQKRTINLKAFQSLLVHPQDLPFPKPFFSAGLRFGFLFFV